MTGTIEEFDVVVVGAGISGVNVAYRLQEQCPDATYVVLEARDSIGGTWDLFKYPGLRSDSDMYTLGFPFEPWNGEKSIADGADILAYIKNTVAKYGIDQHIRTDSRVSGMEFSSERGRWDLEVASGDGSTRTVRSKFVYLASGYYDYHQPFRPDFPGEQEFAGELVHPQLWPEDLDYQGKKVVVIGSGATAITLVPALVQRGAGHVTMLQRTPSYVLALPGRDGAAVALRKRLGDKAYPITRWRNAIQTIGFYQFARRMPGLATKVLTSIPKSQLKGSSAYDPKDFTPPYKPWDQRVCIVPDGDLFKVIRSGEAEIVTDTIDSFVPEGIRVSSGEVLDADIVVTATGLQVQLAGGASLSIDGEKVDLAQHFVYRGVLVEGVPNLSLAIGYTNASWTLRSDLTAQFFCRVVNETTRGGYAYVVPQVGERLDSYPVLDLAAGYIHRAVAQMPKRGQRVPWSVRQNFLMDSLEMRRADLHEELVYVKPGEQLPLGRGSAEAIAVPTA
ncbi:flavin-containing monooxygenase [Dermacoccaceae bacterium W4C1]